MPESILTPEQIAQFHEEGYLILRTQQHGLVESEDLQRWTQEVKGWPKVKGKWMPYEEVNVNGEKQLLRTENFVEYHQNFNDFLCGERMAGLLKQITGDVRQTPSRIFEKYCGGSILTSIGYAPVQGEDQLQARKWWRLQCSSRCSRV
jgi:hypothetical protein